MLRTSRSSRLREIRTSTETRSKRLGNGSLLRVRDGKRRFQSPSKRGDQNSNGCAWISSEIRLGGGCAPDRHSAFPAALGCQSHRAVRSTTSRNPAAISCSHGKTRNELDKTGSARAGGARDFATGTYNTS